MEVTDECVPALNRDKQSYSKSYNAFRKMYEALEAREGPRPFKNAVCRHLCKNDSTAPNGFVCILHTTWGTRSENTFDLPDDARQRNKIAVSSSPNRSQAQLTICPHCGKSGQLRAMLRWHFDRCKLISLTSYPCNASAYD